MKEYIGCDAHKKYSVFSSINELGHFGAAVRVGHGPGEMRKYLETLPSESSIAVESLGSWYWLIHEMEQAGHKPMLVHAPKAKLLMGQVNKTDKLDSRGLAVLNRNGTAPAVWIAPGEVRDQRELVRMRMSFVKIRTLLKNRIHATLAKYNIQIEEVSDIFGVRGRELLQKHLVDLPPYTEGSVREHLKLLDQLRNQIEGLEKQISQIVKETPDIELLKSIPGVGNILAIVIAWEIGSVERFQSAERLASYSGTVPRVKSSGGKTTYGKVRVDVNRYLKWAFIEAANCVMLHQKQHEGTHAVQLYQRIRGRKGHAKAVVALARHLAEACFWILKKKEIYREPMRHLKPISSTPGVSAILA